LVRNVYFYTSVAMVFVLAGNGLLWPQGVQVAVGGVLAVLMGAIWVRTQQFFLLIHSAVYLFAAAVAAGIFGYGASAVLGQPPVPWLVPTWPQYVVVAAAIASAWLAACGPRDERRLVHGPRALIIVTLVWAAGGTLIGATAPIVAGLAGGGVSGGILATLRTCVLSLSALAVAFVGRRRGCGEWGWLVYPILVVTGLKMIAQDFSVSRPNTLFVALASYGVALIVAPRLRRGGSPRQDPPD
jgi:hypothetical protein